MNYLQYRKQAYFPALDGLRALSIALVVLYHTDQQFYGSSPLWDWVGGHLGVPVFFVLSGYLITTLCLREEAATGAVSLKKFYGRRFFRICPAYYAVLLLYCVVVLLSGGERATAFWQALPYYALYLNEFVSIGTFSQSWSLAVEEKFYIIWPIAAFWAFHQLPRFRLALSVLSMIAPVALTLVLPISGQLPSAYGLLMTGCVLAIGLHSERVFSSIRKRLTESAAGLILAGVAVVHLLGAPVRERLMSSGDEFVYAAYIALYGVAAAALLMCAVIHPQSAFFRPLSSRFITFLGRRSYGVYLLHLLALKAARPVWHLPAMSRIESLLVFATALGISVIAADVLYRLVERPGIELGRRLLSRSSPDKAATGNSATIRDFTPSGPVSVIVQSD